MKQATPRSSWIDALRAFITVLVVAHHAALAYTSFSVFNHQAYILSTHPVVDVARCGWLDLPVIFNDTYFMALMFLLSGLFAGRGLQQKGRAAFLRDRVYRLLLPFVISVTLLMPLAYYPAWLLTGKTGGISAYLVDFFTVEAWPVGPPWFLWVLFLLNGLIALFAKQSLHLFRRCAGWLARPAVFVGITVLLYVPPMLCFGPYTWTGIGPFDFQESRLLLYAGYFVLGAGAGMQPLANGPLAAGSPLVQRWPLWCVGSIAGYGLLISGAATGWLGGCVFAFTCALSCLALLTLFSRFVTGSNIVWKALTANAYGIYLLHYIAVLWLQYALLPFHWPALGKFLIVWGLSLLLSAWATALLRRIPVVKRYI